MRVFWLALLLTLGVTERVQATAIVDIVPSQATVHVGDSFQVDLRGSLNRPVLGWGLDLALSAQLASTQGVPTIGADWLAVSSDDGDGLAGLAFPTALSGSSIQLARVELVALAPGLLTLTVAFTPGDLGEGFALSPSGFEPDVRINAAAVTIVPEAQVGAVFSLALLAGIGRRRVTRAR